jgi:hypothetical protein
MVTCELTLADSSTESPDSPSFQDACNSHVQTNESKTKTQQEIVIVNHNQAEVEQEVFLAQAQEEPIVQTTKKRAESQLDVLIFYHDQCESQQEVFLTNQEDILPRYVTLADERQAGAYQEIILGGGLATVTEESCVSHDLLSVRIVAEEGEEENDLLPVRIVAEEGEEENDLLPVPIETEDLEQENKSCNEPFNNDSLFKYLDEEDSVVCVDDDVVEEEDNEEEELTVDGTLDESLVTSQGEDEHGDGDCIEEENSIFRAENGMSLLHSLFFSNLPDDEDSECDGTFMDDATLLIGEKSQFPFASALDALERKAAASIYSASLAILGILDLDKERSSTTATEDDVVQCPKQSLLFSE